MPRVKFSNFIVALVKYLCCVVTRYIVKPRYYEHTYSETVKINNFAIPGIQAKQQQTTQLHPGLLFSQRKKELVLGGIRTHDTLLSRRALAKCHGTITHFKCTCHMCPASEIGTTSLQGTKLLAPKCPLFGGSTVCVQLHCRT